MGDSSAILQKKSKIEMEENNIPQSEKIKTNPQIWGDTLKYKCRFFALNLHKRRRRKSWLTRANIAYTEQKDQKETAKSRKKRCTYTYTYIYLHMCIPAEKHIYKNKNKKKYAKSIKGIKATKNEKWNGAKILSFKAYV